MFQLALVSVLVVCSLGASVPKTRKLNRIVGGENTSIELHPYQVSLVQDGFHYCGGSLIAKNWVLTAGHCVDSYGYDVRVGSSILEEGGVLHAVKQQIRHPDYDDFVIDYDFALFELEKPVTLNDKVQLVKLVDADVELSDGTALNVTGWGATADEYESEILQLVTVPYVPQNICEQSYPGELTDRMFCAGFLGEGGKDSCQGDSGGPVVTKGIQHGIVSWGVGCALPDYPGVYSKVASVRDWIKEVSGV